MKKNKCVTRNWKKKNVTRCVLAGERVAKGENGQIRGKWEQKKVLAGERVAKRENRKIGGKWEQKKCEK